MKINKILLVSIFVLAILMVGAVSAADDNANSDGLTVTEDAGDIIESPVEDIGEAIASPDDEKEIVALDSEKNLAGNDPKYDVNITVQRPDELYWQDDYYIDVSVSPADEDVYDWPDGEVLIYLNGEEISIDSGDYCYYDGSVDEFGEYNFRIEFSGDENFNDAVVEFSYNVTNSMYRIELPEYVDYGSETFEVYSPVANPTDIVITINGKKFNVKYDDDMDEFFCDASALNLGKNTVNVYYPGDEELGEYNKDHNITVLGIISYEDSPITLGDSFTITLELPEDATGELALYSVAYDDDWNAVYTEIASAQMKDGFANVTTSDFNVGSHELFANFTGSYEVGGAYIYLTVEPRINVPKTVIAGDNEYIVVETSEGEKGTVTAKFYDYDEYDYDEDTEPIKILYSDIEEGSAKISLSSIETGKYKVVVNYESETSDCEDDFILYVLDEYDINLNITDYNEKVILNSGDMYVELDLAEYADGIINFYIDGKLVNTFDEIDEYSNYFYVNTTELDIGEHTLKAEFTSEVQGTSSDSVKFNVVSASIYIPDESNIGYSEYASGNTINVDVYDGAKGTVTILIDNEEFLTEIINADDKTYYYYELNNVSRGKHSVSVTYRDDKYGEVTESKTVDFGYVIRIYAYCIYGEDNNITVLVPNDLAKDKLTVTIDGVEKTGWTMNDGIISLNPSKLSIGNHTVVVKYAGDSFYPSKEAYDIFEVYAQIINTADYDMLVGDDKGIYLILPTDANGELNVIIKVEEEIDEEDWEWIEVVNENVPFVNGKAYYSFAELPVNYYEISASYTGDDYVVYDYESSFEVTSVDWGSSEIYLGETKTISFIALDDEPGQLRVVLSRIVDPDKEWDDPVNVVEEFIIPIVDRKASHTFENLILGEYHIFIAEEYIDGGLKGYQGGHDFEVYLKDYEIPIGSFNAGEITPIFLGLPSDADGKVTVEILSDYDDVDESGTPYKTIDYTVKGPVTIDLNDIITEKGYYGIKVTYTGNKGDFERGYYDITIKNSRNQTTMTVSCSDKIKKGSTLTITVNVADVETGNVLVSIAGKNITEVLKNGKADIKVTGLNVGTYVATITYTGSDVYKPITQTKTVNVYVDPVITAKNTAVVYSAKGKYSVTVKGTDGKLAKGIYVVFKIGGKQVAKVKTNAKGVATYTVNKNPGTYKISATALGKTVTKKLTVKHIVTLKTVKVKKSAKKLVLQATLAKVNGKYLKNKKITFKFNGKKVGTAKTKAKGVAKLTIKSKSLNKILKKLKVGKKVTYKATYLKDTVKKTVKVKK